MRWPPSPIAHKPLCSAARAYAIDLTASWARAGRGAQADVREAPRRDLQVRDGRVGGRPAGQARGDEVPRPARQLRAPALQQGQRQPACCAPRPSRPERAFRAPCGRRGARVVSRGARTSGAQAARGVLRLLDQVQGHQGDGAGQDPARREHLLRAFARPAVPEGRNYLPESGLRVLRGQWPFLWLDSPHPTTRAAD
jgi:hypothetical protein